MTNRSAAGLKHSFYQPHTRANATVSSSFKDFSDVRSHRHTSFLIKNVREYLKCEKLFIQMRQDLLLLLLSVSFTCSLWVKTTLHWCIYINLLIEKQTHKF